MKLQKMDVGAHSVKQYLFRINEKEIESLLVVIDAARAFVPRAPMTQPLKEVRRHINITKRELTKALKTQPPKPTEKEVEK